MAAPDPAVTEWIPIWSPAGVIAGGGGGTGGPHHLTHEPGGSDQIVNLSGGVITTGTVADARLSANVALKNAANVFTTNQQVNGILTATGGLGATPLNASQLTTGTVPTPRLPPTIVYTDTPQTITADKIFAGWVRFTEGARSLTTEGFTPSVNFYESGGAVNAHWTRWTMSGGTMSLQIVDDAYANVMATLFQVNRSGVAFGNGAGLTNLNGDYIATGRVNQARLGAGTFDVNTFLRGDGVWAGAPGVPSGLIAIFSTACPVGWSRVAGLDGRFPRGATGWGATGGSSVHSHGVSGGVGNAGAHSHSFSGSSGFSGRTTVENVVTPVPVNRSGLDLMLFLPHDHGFSGNVDISGNTSGVGDHSHSFDGGTNDANHLPPWVDVIFCQKD